MIRCPDNQINASFIDISRIKWLVFLLWSAQLVPLQAFCPGAPKRVPSDSEKHRRVYTSSNVCHSHEWRVDTASGKTECVFTRCPIGGRKNFLCTCIRPPKRRGSNSSYVTIFQRWCIFVIALYMYLGT